MTQELFAILNREESPAYVPAADLSPAVGNETDGARVEVQNHLLESARVKREIAEHGLGPILAAGRLMAKALQSGGKILLCGNGGSAADCQHVAVEFVSRLKRDFARPGLPALALTTDTSFLTAFANDVGFEGIFERQVQTLGQPGDVLIGISTSGHSANVVRAVEAAGRMGMRTIVLTGNGGRLAEMAQVAISVPNANTLYIQEAHLCIEHILCSLVEHYLFGRDMVSEIPSGEKKEETNQ